jgi:hypothetical protein
VTTEQAFQVPSDVLKVIDFWTREWSRMWREETPLRIHRPLGQMDDGGAPAWDAEFERWIDRGSEEHGKTSTGRYLRPRRNPDHRLRTTRAFRKLRKKNVREYEVLYRAVVMRHSASQTAEWMNERAARNGLTDRYTPTEVQILLWSAVDKALRWW